MNPRTILLVALLVSPAWSQEPAPATPAATTRSFDLHNESVKKIVHDTAATQYSVVQASQESASKPKPTETTVKFVPEEKPVVNQEPVYPTRLPEAKSSDGFLSTLIDTVLEDDSVSYAELNKERLACLSRENLKTTTERVASCPGLKNDNRGVTGNPNDLKTIPAP